MLKDSVIKAYRFSEEKHKGQERRFSGLPYFSHPKYVARLVEKLTNNPDLVAAALLHDVVEDTNCSYSELHDHFGSIITMMVHELTNDINDETFKRDKGLYLSYKMAEMSPGALVIKLADRYHNVLFLKNDDVSEKFRLKYMKESEFIISYVRNNRELNDVHKILIDKIDKTLQSLREKF